MSRGFDEFGYRVKVGISGAGQALSDVMPVLESGAKYGTVVLATAAVGYYTWKVVETSDDCVYTFGHSASYEKGRVRFETNCTTLPPEGRSLPTRLLHAVPDSIARANGVNARR